MRKFLGMMLRHWRKSPVKLSLTVLSVALGTAILIIAFSAGSIMKERVEGASSDGLVVYVTNGTWNSDGTVERTMPTQWDADAPEKLVSAGAAVAAAPVMNPPFDEIAAGGSSWRLRSAIGTAPSYFDVFSLDLVAGTGMTDADVDQGSKKVWVSEELATVLFGSAEAAVGQRIQPPGMRIRRFGSDDEQTFIQHYQVAGVFETPSEVSRRSYGIGDAVFPYTALISGGGNAAFERRMMATTFVVKSGSGSIAKIEASARAALAADYGDDIDVAIWEGTPRGASTYLQELRQAVAVFTVSVSLLGVVLLLVSSLGIFSVMVVELLGRRREIALERAIGASRAAVVTEFWSWSVALSAIGAVAGIVLALLLSAPALKTIAPLAGEVSEEFKAAAGATPLSILAGLGLALGCGGVLGALPALGSARGGIADTLREV
ncbi:MAG: ABC transporter permease [Spirochaetaceae bacterium]|nr:ABC transporter permease [Spirochaetaceae bacterium]